MSEKALTRFLDQLLHDEALRQETAASLAGIAARHGFDCTPEDCSRLFTVAPEPPVSELSSDAVKEIAGGAGGPAIRHSISVSFSQQSDGLGGKFTRR